MSLSILSSFAQKPIQLYIQKKTLNSQFLIYEKCIREIPILDLVIILPRKGVADVPVYFIITCILSIENQNSRI
ncbi:hypothetical protein NC653_040141 [Populus alba x Populus x berolinensis]|uniref:Uncharacterized protein n=1 Tax=Populus alba x Populus x berolinensis TaxID=444605 RepID=A0AAD6LD40_9ROSI|nr:hypothetical protein NC653_040141 [Populus alba x Populus x berolinensis]